MAMTIGEASDVAQLLHLLTCDSHAYAHHLDVDEALAILVRLNQRAGKALQLSRIVHTGDLVIAAAELVQRREDAR